jgi:hypothetical protein
VRAAIEVMFAAAGLTAGLVALAAVAVSVSVSDTDTVSDSDSDTVSDTVSDSDSDSVSDTDTSSSVTVSDAGASFLAFAPDFEDFRRWERIPVEGAMLPVGAAPGPTAIYVNRRAPPGARRWPVGTILVKSIENGPPSQWVVHAMVKRGVPFNRDGAIGWEFFELAFDDDASPPRIVWRGAGPPSGHGYAAMGRDAGPDPVPLVCNDCHAAAWQDDGALTPALALGR